MIAWIFLIVVLAFVGKLIYDVQQNKIKEIKPQEKDFENLTNYKEDFQKLAGITPVDKNDEVRNMLVKNNVISPDKLVEELKKEFENSEFPPSDESINVRTERIATIDLNSYGESDPLASVPMSRVSKEAKQKMAEIAREDINKQLEQNAEKFAALFPNGLESNTEMPEEIKKAMMEAPIVKPKRKYTKRKTSTK